MKRLFTIVATLLALSIPAFAQPPAPVQIIDSFQQLGKVGSGGRICVTASSLTGRPYNDHTFVYTFPDGSDSAVTLTVKGSTDGTSPPVTSVTTGTSTTGGTIHFTGEYTNLCIEGTTVTGSHPATVVYTGTKAVTVSVDTTGLATAAKQDTTNTKLDSLLALGTTDDCAGTIPSKEYYISVGTSEDEHQIKATAGTLCGISARNAHASTNAFLKCTNLTAANTTPGSSAIFYEMMIPFGLGYVDNHIDLPFDTALTCYIVTGKAASDATEVGADDVSYVLRYR